MRRLAIAALAVLAVGGASALAADNGVYVGAGVGQSYQELDTNNLPGIDLDDDDFAYKIFAGFRPANFFAVEGGYRDLGKIQDSNGNVVLSTETTAWDAEGLGIISIGPFDIFGKLGVVWWDTELKGVISGSDDDIDALYGIGAAFRLGSFGIRLEYEILDTNIPDDLDMLSVGATFTF